MKTFLEYFNKIKLSKKLFTFIFFMLDNKFDSHEGFYHKLSK